MQDEARDPSAAQEFERIVLPHLDAAYNLASWLVRNGHDAEDVVQEAYLRAVRFFGGYQGGDARSWLLRIVRNTAYTFLEKKRPAELTEEFDETLHATEQRAADAETVVLRAADKGRLEAALEKLPVRFREALILRELEGLSYKEIAEVMEIPMGSVMSSLARGRERLRELLEGTRGKEVRSGLRG
jgi:RNA polymerase sigma-70 factor, ECF subfamily